MCDMYTKPISYVTDGEMWLRGIGSDLVAAWLRGVLATAAHAVVSGAGVDGRTQTILLQVYRRRAPSRAGCRHGRRPRPSASGSI